MAKRRAGNELNRDNWDEEEEPEEIGSFKIASDDILKGRVIKQARRRITSKSSTSESDTKPIFSGFTGFARNNETSKFSFASGDGNTNGPKTAFSFLSKSNVNSDSETKPTFSFLSSSTFGSKSSGSETPAEKSPSFSTTLNENTSNSKATDSSTTKPMSDKDVSETTPKSGLLFSSTIPSKKSNEVSDTVNKDKLNELSKEFVKTEKQGSEITVESKDDRNKTPDEIFLQKLRSLNLLCAEWIIKHLNENLGYILTPIFDDYKKYLNQLKEERQRANSSNKILKISNDVTPGDISSKVEVSKPSSLFKVPDFKASISKLNSPKGFFLSPPKEEVEKPAGFKFTNNAEGSTSNFKFSGTIHKNEGIAASKPSDTNGGNDDTGMFKFGNSIMKSTTDEEFGSVKSPSKEENESKIETPKMQSFFSFSPRTTPLASNPLVAQPAAATANEANSNDDEEDAPPAKEDVAVTEEGAIYDKKCKVFIKKDGNFVDHGVGFLFIKLVDDERKCQVIVRANNKLANIIINVLLTNSVPIQLMGKNNVMLICCPTPEAKPSSVLLKVKTADDAQELLNIMNKHKK